MKTTIFAVAMLMSTATYGQTSDSATALPQAWRTTSNAIPPARYDHPYTGKLIIKRNNIAGLQYNCPGSMRKVLGCTFRFDDACIIYLADDADIKPYGITPAIIMRHEIGHCNGWPKDHRP